MTAARFLTLTFLTACFALCLPACPNETAETTSPAKTTLTLDRQADGTLELCDPAGGQCRSLPYDGGCDALEVDVYTDTGGTCERCVMADGSVTDLGCNATSVTCVLVTLQDPDCVVCAYTNDLVIYSTCTPEQPEDCLEYSRSDGVLCQRCYDLSGDVVYDSCGPSCANVGCPAVQCAAGFELRRIPGECCAQCLPIDGCDEYVCSQEDGVPACPANTVLVRDPIDCCGYYCQPTECPPPPIGPMAQPCTVDSECPPGSTCDAGRCADAAGCASDLDCPADAWCEGGTCINDLALCPPGYAWNEVRPECGCVPKAPPLVCLTNADCELLNVTGDEPYYCYFDGGTCVAGDPTDPGGTLACAGTCRPINPHCPDPAAGGIDGQAFAYCEGAYRVEYDWQGCPYPVCICADGVASADGSCTDQCDGVACFAPPPDCDLGYHVDYFYPYCCGGCVPDVDCDPTATELPTSAGVTCTAVRCATGFHEQTGPNCCPACAPDETRACTSHAECLPGEVCETSCGGCDPVDVPTCPPCAGECVWLGDCHDTDAINPSVAGATTATISGVDPVAYLDECIVDEVTGGAFVIEYYCANTVGATGVGAMVIECPAGCEAGACL